MFDGPVCAQPRVSENGSKKCSKNCSKMLKNCENVEISWIGTSDRDDRVSGRVEPLAFNDSTLLIDVINSRLKIAK